MNAFFEVAKSGIAAVLLHPLRSAVTGFVLLAVLVPFLVGLGIATGIRQDAEISIDGGADLYVSRRLLDRPAAIELSLAKTLAAIDGVQRVVPRIVAGLTLGKNDEHAVLVGIEPQEAPEQVHSVAGRLYRAGSGNEVVLGSQLARRLGLAIGSSIPPFYRNDRGEKISTVVGIFQADVPHWSANLLFTSFETAGEILNQSDRASDLLVYCRPGYAPQVKSQILRWSLANADVQRGPLQVVSKDELRAQLPSGLLHREGIFHLHYVLLLSAAILVVLVTSGVGLSERRREIGILKMTGWHTDEILLRGAVESAVIGLAAGAASIVLAYVWLRGLNGYWIAGVFLGGIDRSSSVTTPFRLLPVPALLSVLLAQVVVGSGTLVSSWRAASVPPREVLR